MAMYYVAIVLPASVDAQVLSWKTHMLSNFGCRAALKSPAHITLVPPFYLDNSQENVLADQLENASRLHESFSLQLDGFSHFGTRVIFVDVKNSPQLDELARHLQRRLNDAGLPVIPDPRPFHPHVTIATRDLQRTHFEEAWTYFKSIDYNETVAANAFSLLKLGAGKWEIKTTLLLK